MQIQKPVRIVDKDYLEHIKHRSCCVKDNTCLGDVVPHHTISVGARGSDYRTVSLCAQHHHEVHFVGRKTFQEKYNVDFREVIIKQLIDYIRELKQLESD